MSKKVTILIVVLTVILGTGILYVLLGGKTPGGSPIIGGSPFGTPPEDSEGVPGETVNPGETGGLPGEATTPVDASGRPINPLYKLSEGPIAGAVAIVREGVVLVRYVDRATGHVTEVSPDNLSRTKIFNTTRPHIYDALWRSDGTGFIERTVAQNSDNIANTAMILVPPTSTSTDGLYTARAILLRGDVGEFMVNVDNTLVYNLEDTGGVFASTFTGERPRILFTSEFGSWRLYPAATNTAFLASKASSAALGYGYSLDLRSGALTKVLGPLSALSILPSLDGRRVAFGYTQGSERIFAVRNTSTGLTSRILPPTLPEKCVWSRESESVIYCGVPESGLGNDVPDLWYQGVVVYSDKLWRFNADTETAEIILDPKNGLGIDVDVINPFLSRDENYFFFTNKSDLSLWVIRLVP